MTIQAQQALENAQSRYAEPSVGDNVFATINNGSTFVSCYIYAIEDDKVKCLWNAVVFSVEIELFLASTLLIERFNRKAIIAEIMRLSA